jgi:hypothetical protein
MEIPFLHSVVKQESSLALLPQEINGDSDTATLRTKSNESSPATLRHNRRHGM